MFLDPSVLARHGVPADSVGGLLCLGGSGHGGRLGQLGGQQGAKVETQRCAVKVSIKPEAADINPSTFSWN